MADAVAVIVGLAVVLLRVRESTAHSLCSLYVHPDNNQGVFGSEPGTSLPDSAGFYPLQSPELTKFDNELSSMAIADGRLVLYADALGQEWVATIGAQPGFRFETVNLQKENDNLVSAVDWTPLAAEPADVRRSLLSIDANSRLSVATPPGRPPLGGPGRARLLEIEEWGAVPTDSKLVLFEHTPSSYSDFDRGQQLDFNTCSKAHDLSDYGFSGAASSMLVCGGRARGYAAVGLSQQLFDVVVKNGSCIDFVYGPGSNDILSSVQFNMCGCGIEC